MRYKRMKRYEQICGMFSYNGGFQLCSQFFATRLWFLNCATCCGLRAAYMNSAIFDLRSRESQCCMLPFQPLLIAIMDFFTSHSPSLQTMSSPSASMSPTLVASSAKPIPPQVLVIYKGSIMEMGNFSPDARIVYARDYLQQLTFTASPNITSAICQG
jgi:hypothetical protein